MSDAVRSILMQIDGLPADERETLLNELLSDDCVYLGADCRSGLHTRLLTNAEEAAEKEVLAARKAIARLPDLAGRDEFEEELLEDNLDDARARLERHIDAKNLALIQEAVGRATTEGGRPVKEETKKALSNLLLLRDQGLSYARICKRLNRSRRWAEVTIHYYGLKPLLAQLRQNRHKLSKLSASR